MTTVFPPEEDYPTHSTPRSGELVEPGRHKRNRPPEVGFRPARPGGRGPERNGSVAVLGARGPAAETAPHKAWAAPEGHQPRRVLPLLGVLALQAAISLSLVWSNTAFGDEANYLWVGHLELAHWFGGAPTPHFDVLSGAPLIYPPLGALANSIGGLAGARIFSLLLMLGATALLYSTARRLFGSRAALAAAALWAVSVSSLKLGAFATFDPLAVFLMCLTAWLGVQAAYRRHAAELVILAGLTLVLADLTAYSYAIYDVAVIPFVFCVWWLRLGPRRALALALWLSGALVALGFILPTVMGLWAGIVAVTITRSGGTINKAEFQGYVLVAQLAWEWSGLVAVLGLAGTLTAAAGHANKRVVALLAVLAASAFLVPLYQLHLQTGWALDKHLACGVWLAAMPAGYLIARVARLPAPARGAMALAGMAALAFPTATGWTLAYSDYRTWPNATRLIAAVKPLADAPHTGGLFSGSTDNWLLEYYTDSEAHGPQWGAGPQISLNPQELPYSSWPSYFQNQLNAKRYSVIALPFPVNTTAFSVAPGSAALPSRTQLDSDLHDLTVAQPFEVGVDDLAAAVEANIHYQLVAVVPYSDDLAPGSYLVWKRIGG